MGYMGERARPAMASFLTCTHLGDLRAARGRDEGGQPSVCLEGLEHLLHAQVAVGVGVHLGWVRDR